MAKRALSAIRSRHARHDTPADDPGDPAATSPRGSFGNIGKHRPHRARLSRWAYSPGVPAVGVFALSAVGIERGPGLGWNTGDLKRFGVVMTGWRARV